MRDYSGSPVARKKAISCENGGEVPVFLTSFVAITFTLPTKCIYLSLKSHGVI